MNTLRLHYTRFADEEGGDMDWALDTYLPLVFSQASRTIRDHPCLRNIKHFTTLGRPRCNDLGRSTKDGDRDEDQSYPCGTDLMYCIVAGRCWVVYFIPLRFLSVSPPVFFSSQNVP